MLDKLFGKSTDEHGRIIYPILFFVILTSTTFFFFDYINIQILGVHVHFSTGLILFPLTFSITNLMQYKYGPIFANTCVRYGFLGDLLLVIISFALCNIGERKDYGSVFN